MSVESEAISHLRALIKDPMGHVAEACLFLARVDHGMIEAEPSEAEKVCFEAYQAAGSMLSDLGAFETEEAQKLLDNLGAARLIHKDVLPWHSFVGPY